MEQECKVQKIQEHREWRQIEIAEQKILWEKKKKDWHLQSEVNKQFKYEIETLKKFWIQFITISKQKLAEDREIKITNMQRITRKYKQLIKHFQ